MTEVELPDTASSRGDEKKQRDGKSSGTLLQPIASEGLPPEGSASEGSKTLDPADGNSTNPSRSSEASKMERFRRHKERQQAKKANDNSGTSTPVSPSSTTNQKLRLAPGVAPDSHGTTRVGALDDGVTNGDNDVENNHLIVAEIAPDVDDLIETEASIEFPVGQDEPVLSTDAPTPDKTSSPTPDETPSPTPIPVSQYNAPKVTECETMKKGLPRADADGYQGLLERKFVVVFHTQVSADSTSTPTTTTTTLSTSLLSVFEQQIQRLLRPELVGCTTASSTNMLDYLIFDFDVSVAQDTDSTCVVLNDDQSTTTQLCHVIDASLSLWLQGNEKDFLVQAFMLQALKSLDLPVTLELEGQFLAIEVEDVVLTPTREPTRGPTPGPTRVPTSDPSPGPTMRPTEQPTLATSRPTSRPTAMLRADKVKTILADFAPLDEQSLAWLTLIDSWEPDKEDPNHDYLWLERYTMALLYLSTNGPSWTNSNNWMTSEPVCNWYFSSSNECPGHRPVTSLDLSENNLKGTLPPVIGNLSLLTKLDLGSNKLTSTIPSSIWNLTLLEHLSLWSNELTSSIPSSIGNLNRLTWLSVGLNKLTSSIPSSVGNLIQLGRLTMSGNEFTSAIPSSIGNLTLLTHLSLRSNNLTSSIPSAIGDLSLLTHLSMYSNNLTNSIPSSIGNLSLLTSLSMHSNKLTSNIPSSIGNLSLLENLDLRDNELSGSIPSLPSSMTSCKLENNCFQAFGNAETAGCGVIPNCS